MSTPTLLKRTTVALDQITVESRLRPVSEAGVNSLIASVTQLGVMKDPIHLRQKKGGALVLMAGAHRNEMAHRMGWLEIEAKVWADVTDDWAELMEIDDNLAGAEMNALDTAIFLAARKRVYERLHPETKRGVAGGLARQGSANDIMSFAVSTAEKFGLSKRHVERMIAVGSALHQSEITQLRAASKPVRLVDLQALAKVGDAVERQRVVEMFSAGEAKNFAVARTRYKAEETGFAAPVKDPADQQFLALKSAWVRASATARRRFLEDAGADLAALLPRPQVVA